MIDVNALIPTASSRQPLLRAECKDALRISEKARRRPRSRRYGSRCRGRIDERLRTRVWTSPELKRPLDGGGRIPETRSRSIHDAVSLTRRTEECRRSLLRTGSQLYPFASNQTWSGADRVAHLRATMNNERASASSIVERAVTL